MTAKRHYHVWAGISYARDCDGSYATLAEARDELAGIRREYEDFQWQGEDPTEYRVRGNVRQGFVYIEATDPGSVWQRSAVITPCDCAECAPDVWEPAY